MIFVDRNLLKCDDILGKPGKFWCWYHKDSIFYHPGLLNNAYTSKDQPNHRKDLGVPDDVIVLSDSGGFQIHQNMKAGKVIDIEPLEILRWQERNGDVAFIIDVPIGAEHNDSIYEEGLKQTIANAQLFQDNMVSDDLRMLNVLHGHTYDRTVRWYEELSKFTYRGKNGWSVGFHPSGDVMGQARMMGFLMHMGHTGYVHFLGTSGWNVQPLLVYGSQFFDRLVYDSSSYASGYTTRTYVVPPDVNKGEEITFGDRLQSWHGLKKPPCVCPVCTYVLENDYDFSTAMRNPKAGGHLISMHNLCLMLERHKKLEALLDDKDRYFKYVHDHCSKASFMALHYIDDCKTMGYVAATQHYDKFFARTVVSQVQAEFGSMMLQPSKPKEKPAIRNNDPIAPKINKKTGLPRKVKIKPPKGPKVVESIAPLVASTDTVSPDTPEQIDSELLTSKQKEALVAAALDDKEFVAEFASELIGTLIKPTLSPVIPTPEEIPEKDTEPSPTYPDNSANFDAGLIEIPKAPKVPKVLLTEPKQHKAKTKPLLLDLSGTEEVHLEVVVEKPACFGTHEPNVCTGDFCQSVFEECKGVST